MCFKCEFPFTLFSLFQLVKTKDTKHTVSSELSYCYFYFTLRSYQISSQMRIGKWIGNLFYFSLSFSVFHMNTHRHQNIHTFILVPHIIHYLHEFSLLSPKATQHHQLGVSRPTRPPVPLQQPPVPTSYRRRYIRNKIHTLISHTVNSRQQDPSQLKKHTIKEGPSHLSFTVSLPTY